MTPSLGAPIARGSRSIVHRFGTDAVAKVPLPDTPEDWIRIEADYSAAVREAGAPVPEFLGFDEHDGRVISIYRRAFGTLMWDDVLGHPDRADEHARRLVELQDMLAALVPPIVLPAQVDRLRSKIRIAGWLADPALAGVLDAIPDVGNVVLCHGDLHPRNVILTAGGPMVVDWFDASRGDVVGDVARTTILLEADSVTQHLAGAGSDLLTRLRAAYVAAAASTFGFDTDTLERWRVVASAARVAEGLPPEVVRGVVRQWVREG